MPLSTLSELRTSIAYFMNRSDMTTAQQDTFVALVESDIRNDVRVRAMEDQTTVALTSQTLPSPTLLLEARQLLVDGWRHEYRTPEAYDAYRLIGGVNRIYTQIGQTFLVNSTGSARLTYTKALEALTAGTNTNYVLTQAPDVYLYGACAHAAQYYQDAGNLERFKALYLGAVKRLNDREQQARYSGPLQIYPAQVE